MIGTTLSQFNIKAKLGEGGMGEVWLAEDSRLGREVALKVLPAEFAADPERMARFEREAKVLASLNHPSIAHLYGLELVTSGTETEMGTGTGAGSEAGSSPQAPTPSSPVTFLVMELVEGEDLSHRIARGPIPMAEALPIALQIAQALEAAHEQGVIHRDLKPANVRLTADARAKVLDFGLAKAFESGQAGDQGRSQTITSAGTVAGLILGTAAYMSPEQASGQPTDRRCDIWSFGVVLHEMLTGKRLFDGETISHTLADVLRAPIDVSGLPDDTPASVRRLIERCLERDRLRRLRDIGEARVALEDAIDRPDDESPAGGEAAGGRSAFARLVPWLVAAAGVVLAAVGLLWDRGAEPALGEPVRRFALEVPNSGNTRQGDGVSVAISSDGRNVVTRGGSGADDMLYLRRIDDFDPRPLVGTANGRTPIFSPDDHWIAFIDAVGLSKVRATGGPPIHLTQFPSSPNGIDWGPDGMIYYAHQGEIWRVSDQGGEPERLLENDLKEGLGYGEPFVLPDAEVLLCSTQSGPGRSGELFAFDLGTKKLKPLEVQGTDPRYLPTGQVLFAQSDQVFVAPFDLDTLEFTGSPSPVLDRAWVDQGEVQMDVSDDGTVVYLPNTRGETQSLVTVSLEGKVESLLPDGLPFASLNDPRVSPDGRRLMVSVDSGAIWMVDLDTRTPTLMTESGFYPLWSPDGRELVYASTRNKTFDVYRRPVDLSLPESLLLDFDNNLRTGDWTRQGVLVIREEIPGKGMDLRYWPDPGDPSTLAPLLEGPDDELAPVVSRDGEWLAYVSNYSGTDEVYVTSFPATGARLKISIKGGNSPTWAPDGKTLYYLEGMRMIAVSIETAPSFRVTGRRQLFEGDYVQYRWSRQYDTLADGSGFVMIRNPPRGNVEVVTRWFDELRRLAAGD
jgi:serine/threonine-protein kinase